MIPREMRGRGVMGVKEWDQWEEVETEHQVVYILSYVQYNINIIKHSEKRFLNKDEQTYQQPLPPKKTQNNIHYLFCYKTKSELFFLKGGGKTQRERERSQMLSASVCVVKHQR